MVFSVNMGTGVNVVTLTTNSTVTTGETTQFGWSSHQKRNYDTFSSGVGIAVTNVFNCTVDSDGFDATFVNPKVLGGFTNQMT